MIKMIKLIGSVLIVFAGAKTGFMKAGQLDKQLEGTRLVIHILNDVKIMLESSFLTTDEIIERLESDGEYKKTGLFCFSESGFTKDELCENIDKCQYITDKNDRERLKAYFLQLGTTDITGEISKTDLCIGDFKNREEVCKEKVRKYSKLYRGLGILGGAMTAVILM